MTHPRIALSLGGGGIGGIGHIPVLQGLDDLGLRPIAISGVSAGAIVGAGYASGLSGDALHAHVTDLADRQGKVLLRALRPRGLGNGLNAIHVIETILPPGVPSTLEDLDIPLTIGTTDIENRQSVFFGEGEIRPLLAATMSIPGLFRPVAHQGRLLVDGGVLDNFALSTLPEADLVIAVDAASQPPDMEVPRGGLRAGLHAMRVMMEAMADDNLARHTSVVRIRARKSPLKAAHFLDAQRLLVPLAPLRDETVRKVSQALSGN